MKLIPLQSMKHYRGLLLILEIHKAEVELPTFSGLLGNQTSIHKTWERTENVTDLALSGVIRDSFLALPSTYRQEVASSGISNKFKCESVAGFLFN